MQYRQLGPTGLQVSVLSYGASALGGVFGHTSDAEGIRSVHLALDHGINFFDVSPYYGATRAEKVLGRALQGIDRSRYILATKVGQYAEGEFDFSADRVIRSFDESCRRLGVDYIDLLQCHDVEYAPLDQIVHETLPALGRLRAAGRIRHVGITGLPLKALTGVLDRVEPGVVQAVLSFCHFTLNDSSLGDLVPYFQAKNVGIINAAPTGMGLLTQQGVPAWHPATRHMVETTRQCIADCRAAGVDIVKLAIQYSISHPGIATTLVSSAKPQEMLQNIRSAEGPVEFEHIGRVLEKLRSIRNHNFTRGLPENRDPIIA